MAGGIGALAGCGAALFSWLIDVVTQLSTVQVLLWAAGDRWRLLGLTAVPAVGLLLVAWITRRFAPEAQGHGVPEVITAVARHEGRIRPQVVVIKTLASALSIGTGASVGREGPIVQIGSALGSVLGQLFKLSVRNINVLVAAGAAAGISATFNAPLAGVMFASEIILGSFAVESLTPIVIASVLADVVQQHVGEHRFEPAFRGLAYYDFEGAWHQLPSYLLLGLLAGLAAAGFIRLLYATEDWAEKRFTSWVARALVLGGMVGLAGALYPMHPPSQAETDTGGTPGAASTVENNNADHDTRHLVLPPLMGVGYGVVEHALHLEVQPAARPQDVSGESTIGESTPGPTDRLSAAAQRFLARFFGDSAAPRVEIPHDAIWPELAWLAALVLLKPLATSLSLAGGGSGGVFAPSLYLGATLGASVGLLMNLWFPQFSNAPGVYAIVGMGAVVAGTTHGVLSAILIVYEMTSNYQVILPIMAAAGVASLVSRLIEPESIYYKKLSRRGEIIARGHDMHRLDHIMVRDVMVRSFPRLRPSDNVLEIIRVARANPHIESLPVMDEEGQLTGIIRPTDLHRVLDSDISPQLVNAEDIALRAPISVAPDENLIEAMRDFGVRDVETLPVEVGQGKNRKLVGLLLRADVMRRYRQEMLARH
jgi:CIC family chloride channel protein